jgi:hypothetical protein
MKERIDSDVGKCLATKAEQHNILSKSITSQKTSLAIEKFGKRQKSARLDFSGAKGVVYLSIDYHIIDGDQAPISNKGGLSSSSESAESTLRSAELITTYLEPARLTSQSARLTAFTACPESVTSQSTRPTAPVAIVPTSAQVGLADSVD